MSDVKIDEAAMKNWAAASRLLPHGQGAEGLAKAIKECDKKRWSQLRAALGVSSKTEAVDLVSSDPRAREIAVQVLGAQDVAETPMGETGTRKPGRTGKMVF